MLLLAFYIDTSIQDGGHSKGNFNMKFLKEARNKMRQNHQMKSTTPKLLAAAKTESILTHQNIGKASTISK